MTARPCVAAVGQQDSVAAVGLNQATLHSRVGPDRKLPAVSNVVCCLQVDIRKTWLLFSSIVLAFAFVFGKRKVCRASDICLVFDMLEAAI